MKFILERVRNITKELKGHEYLETLSFDKFKMKDGHFLTIAEVDSSSNPWKDYKRGDEWGAKDTNHWFRVNATIPKAFQGKTVGIKVHDGKGGWDAINPQFVLYINGELIQGLDVNHTEVVLGRLDAGQELKIDVHAYAGMVSDAQTEVKNRFYIELVAIDEVARDLYYNLLVPTQILNKLGVETKEMIDTLAILNNTINLLDLRKPKSENYNNSIKEANDHILKEYYEKMGGHEEIIATCVGHTHIDVAWWWTVAQTRQKVTRSFSTVLNMMKQYPEYIFMSSQPQLYKFLKEDQPEVYAEIKERINEGRWEAEGAMWLEADTNVTSGESLVRQILYGTKFFKEEFGVENKVLWLPDVFGYSAALPQILKKSDIDYFMTTKIAWNQYNKLPMDTFNWEGIDGTNVFTHFVTTKDPNQDKKSHFTTYNGMLHPGAVIGAWERYQEKEINNDVLISYGYGDGGGGPTTEMLEVGRRLEKGLPGCPKVKQGTSREYFDKIFETTKDHKRLPKWVGELYLEYHRGTYTSMARNKKYNRKNEFLYQDVECLSSLSLLNGGDYNKDLMDSSWEIILLNQFHDILPGTSIKEVYEVNKIEYEEILKDGKEEATKQIDYITSKINLKKKSVIIFNTLSHERNDLVKINIGEMKEFSIWENGIKLESQVIVEKGIRYIIFMAIKIPSKGYKSFEIKDIEATTNTRLKLDKNGMENKFYNITFDDKFQFTSIFDKCAKREILKEGELGNVLQAFEDKPIYYDNWDIDCYFTEKMWVVDDVKNVIFEEGTVRSTLVIEREFVDSTIIQRVHFYADSPRIDFDTYVDWKQHQVLLKVCFPIDVYTNKATYDIQFGNLERPTHKNTSWDEARFEVCGHKWVDVSEEDYGVTLLNDCKYGHDVVGTNLRLTLLKSGTVPHPTTDQEEHEFTYSLLPHVGDWKRAKVYEHGYDLNVPLYSTIKEAQLGELKDEFSFVSIDTSNVIVETVKKAEYSDEIIVRMYETTGKRTRTNIQFGNETDRIKEVNLIERELRNVESVSNGIAVEFKPYEIKTIKVKFK